MGKVLAVVLWAWIPFCWQPLRGQAPSVGVDPGQNQKKQPSLGADKANSNQRGTDSAPLVIETHTRPDTPQEAAKHKAENDTKEYRDGWTFRLTVGNAIATGVLVIFTGGLFIIGWRGVRAANRTLGAIERQANLMDRQILLQEATLVPWASIQNWKVETLQFIGPLSNMPKALAVSFDLVNESSFPITTGGRLKFLGTLPGSCECVIAVTLLPKIPVTITAHIYPAEAQAAEYADGELRISVHGELSHIGVLGKRSLPMEIHGNIVCGRRSLTRLEFGTIWISPAGSLKGS